MTIWILIAAMVTFAVLMRPLGATTVSTGVTLRGLNGAFFPSFETAPSLRKEICTEITSDGKLENFKFVGQLPMPREWKGRRQTQALRDYGFTIEIKHWEDTLAIDRDELDDDQTGQLRRRAGLLGTRFAQHPDGILNTLIVGGESALCYDGQYFFDTDHVEGDSGTQSNSISVDIATPTAPTTDEFEAAVWAAVTQLSGFKDDQGEPCNFFSDLQNFAGLMFLVPPAYMKVACKVLGANAAQVLGNNTNILAGRGRVYVSPRLTWTTKFAVLKVDEPERPFVFLQRKTINTEVKDDSMEKDIFYLADSRYAVGYGFWQKGVLVTFT